jgi:hypothetical protein
LTSKTNYYKLQGAGQGMRQRRFHGPLRPATVSNVKWYAILKTSDPQVPNPSGNIEQGTKEAGQIYSGYGAFILMASVMATCAVIQASLS